MQKYFRISIFTIISAGLFFFSNLKAQELQIFQTNSANGNLFPCRCPSEPKGGLAKQATLIKKLAAGRDYLLLESGDIFGINSDRASDSLVLAALQAMKYQAVAVGDQELGKGGGYFLQLKESFDIPFVSANLLYRNKLLVQPYRIVKAVEVKAAVIGLISSKTLMYYPPEKLEGIKILPPDSILRALIDSLKDKVDLFILASHLGFEEELDLAKKFPELSLIIGGHSQTELERPYYRSSVPIIESGAGGKKLTRAYLAKENGKWILSESKLFGVTSDLPDDPIITSIIGRAPEATRQNNDTGYVARIGQNAIHIFVAPDCPDCQRLEEGLFKKIARQHSGRLNIHYHQVDDPREYKLLMDYERLIKDRNNQIPAVVINSRILGGVEEIERDLERLIKEALDDQAMEKPGSKGPAMETSLDKQGKRAEKTMETGTGDRIYLAFVTNVRCQKCSRAEYMLKAMKEKYPNLRVEKIDVASDSSKLLVEALGIMYGLPDKKRMIAPSAFVGRDFLVGDEINDQSLSELLIKYKSGSGLVSWIEAKKYLPQAKQSVVSRFASFGLWGVLGAGLLDGINPCSLAVLVFFISYLAFVGRKRWEILAVGFAYTLADFMVYFLIGIGGMSFLMTLKALPLFSKIFYWLAVVAGLVLAFYNLRDYFKARKGDLSRMDLQLSTKTKQRIHRIIRDRMGAGSLIGGAFLVGLITSVLEFACTGQVYLPTIAFVSQIATYKYQAYGYLLLYNLMFEVPMIITFVIAFWGVSSKRIAGWAQISVAVVKLATAILFTVMSLALILVMLN